MPQLQRLKAREILARDAPAIYLLATKETVGMSFKVHGIADLPLGVVYADRDTWKERSPTGDNLRVAHAPG